MAPFVPDIISDQLNLVVALVLGVAFGFVLEQAGFSSCRRLAGLFYGYDFTVLRVFFTAAVTAACGVLLLGYFGYLDLTAIYINPTWLWPTVVGGAIMGLGFLLGGYCPGTSLAAAAIGKIDGIIFVLGGVAGVFAFAEAYPWLQAFNDSSSLGEIKVFNSIGVSQGLFILLLIVMAVGAFSATTWIERKVNKQAPSMAFPVKWHRIAGCALILVGVALAVMPDRKQHLLNEVTAPAYAAQHPASLMTVDELVYRVVDRDPKLKIYDLRKSETFAKLAMPGSTSIQLDDLFKRDLTSELSLVHTQKVFVADDPAAAKTAALVLGRLGYENVFALDRSFDQLAKEALSPPTKPSENPIVAAYRQRVARDLQAMIAEAKQKASGTKKKDKKIVGGC